jgi:hypothetical protein
MSARKSETPENAKPSPMEFESRLAAPSHRSRAAREARAPAMREAAADTDPAPDAGTGKSTPPKA